MTYSLQGRLVVGIASSALFDLTEPDGVFSQRGVDSYRTFQRANLDNPLPPGVAFPFIRRLLSLNDLSVDPDDPLVEVVVLSRNDPDTGLRVMSSIEHYGLAISRAIFTQGKSPYMFMNPLNMSLFLTADQDSVVGALAQNLPAGRVLDSSVVDDPHDHELRIAFDFDGVLADDAAERVYQEGDLAAFREYETARADQPHEPGPLKRLLDEVCHIQRRELQLQRERPDYVPRLRISLVTARNAPAHKRAVSTLRAWGVTVNDAFFLGGVDKGLIMPVLRPHIFFDDQERHLESTARSVPSVHIPFGWVNTGPRGAGPMGPES